MSVCVSVLGPVSLSLSVRLRLQAVFSEYNHTPLHGGPTFEITKILFNVIFHTIHPILLGMGLKLVKRVNKTYTNIYK